MKACWIGILGTGALVISASGQNGVGPQALATNARLGTVSPDKRLQLPSTGRQILDDQTQNETEQVSDVHISGKTLVVLPPDAPHDVPGPNPGVTCRRECRLQTEIYKVSRSSNSESLMECGRRLPDLLTGLLANGKDRRANNLLLNTGFQSAYLAGEILFTVQERKYIVSRKK
jgi:hypothetical protein